MKSYPKFNSRVARSPLDALRTLFIALIWLAGALCVIPAAHAQSGQVGKIAADLQQVIAASTTPSLNWAKDKGGVRYLKVLIIANSSDPDLVALRQDVIARGGSVYFKYVSVPALSVMLPAGQVAAIAARSDVQGVSPNRLTTRTTSTLEAVTGTLTPAVRTYSGSTSYSGLDGTGVGIAVLDSGIARGHVNMKARDGVTLRIKSAVDFQRVGDANAAGVKDWTVGIDASASLIPGGPSLASFEAAIDESTEDHTDLYGHGTHVASVAAGRGYTGRVDSTGVAPNANLYDVKVLDAGGVGQLSDALAGIDWVIYHAKDYNIRVLNLSLAADSTETWQTDPLARAARSAVAAGITVVVAAGNFGKSASGAEVYGTVSSPGHDPSVITVGSANTKGTTLRSDDVVNGFSSRGPTRGSYVDAQGTRHYDMLLKPDLIAPGNKIVGAVASNSAGSGAWAYLPDTYPQLSAAYGTKSQQQNGQQLFVLSGTSIAAPAVSGAVALMLQANPGLTPPLIKAILQYSAQPLPGFNLLQQGTGLLNVDGAVRLAQALRTDIKSGVESRTLAAGTSLLAAGKTLPQASSTINGQTFKWSRVAYAGGSQLVSGDALFTRFQPVWDHRLVWASGVARRAAVTYWPASLTIPANTYVKSIVWAAAPDQSLVTAGVVAATALAGKSSYAGKTGMFIPTATLSGWLQAGSGTVLGQGMIISEGVILSEGIILSEGMILSEGVILSEGIIVSEGVILSEGGVITQSGLPGLSGADDASLLGEP